MERRSTQFAVVTSLAASGLLSLGLLAAAGGELQPPRLAPRSGGELLAGPPEPAPPHHVPAPAGETLGTVRTASPMPPTRDIAVVLGSNAEGLHRFFAASDGDVTVRTTHLVDRSAIELMLAGRADFGIVALPLTGNDVRAGLHATLLGVELFALAVPGDLPLHSLDSPQVRGVLTGRITDWGQLGLPARPIVVVGPADRQLATRAARSLVPGDPLLASLVQADGDRGVFDRMLQIPGAIGIVRVAAAARDPGARLLAIDGAQPCWLDWRNGSYRAGVPMTLVTVGQPSGTSRERLETYRRGAVSIAGDWLTLPW